MNLDNQPLPLVTQDQFVQWLDSLVTKHLITDLQEAFLDSALDPLPIDSIESIAIECIRRETVRAFVDLILEWVPDGAEPDEADEEGEGDGDGNQ